MVEFQGRSGHFLCGHYHLHYKGVEKVSIGANIKARRVALDMTQKELAERVNVDQSMICQIERGTKAPSLPLSKEIADALECQLDDLIA